MSATIAEHLQRRIRFARIACVLFTVAAVAESVALGFSLTAGYLIIAAKNAFATACFTVSAILQVLIIRRLRRQVPS